MHITCNYKLTHSHCREEKRVKTERLNADVWLGAFPLALTGEINHHNYGLAQVNGDRSPLSFPSSRCFLLIRASEALVPTDPWPMRSKCALDACEVLGTGRELVPHIPAGILMVTSDSAATRFYFRFISKAVLIQIQNVLILLINDKSTCCAWLDL